MTTVAEVI